MIREKLKATLRHPSRTFPYLFPGFFQRPGFMAGQVFSCQQTSAVLLFVMMMRDEGEMRKRKRIVLRLLLHLLGRGDAARRREWGDEHTCRQRRHCPLFVISPSFRLSPSFFFSPDRPLLTVFMLISVNEGNEGRDEIILECYVRGGCRT